MATPSSIQFSAIGGVVVVVKAVNGNIAGVRLVTLLVGEWSLEAYCHRRN